MVLVALLADACTATERYVSMTDSGCPDGAVCHSLSFYVNDTAAYFTNDTVFYFLEGIHELNQDLQIIGAVNLTLQGYNSSRASILCANSKTFDFFGGESIILLWLTFDSCKRVGFSYLTNVFISDSTILRSEHGFHFLNGFDIYLQLCNFTDTGNGTVFYYDPPSQCFPSLEHFSVTLTGLSATSARVHAASFVLNQGASYGVNILIQNSFFSYTGGIEFSVYNESIHSIVLDGVSSNSVDGLALYGQISYSQNTQCYHDDQNRTLTPLKISNSNFQHTGAEMMDSAITIDLAYPIYSCEQEMVIDSCSISNIFMNSATVTINNVVIANSQSSGLVAYNSQIRVKGMLNVVANNSAFNGGGMSMYGGSSIILYPPCAVRFINNTARDKGGAVYWEGNPYYPFNVYCANLITIATYDSDSQHVFLTFENNTAKIAGNDIFGLPTVQCNPFVYARIIQFNRFPMVSGNPIGVCTCEPNGELDCTTSYIELMRYPGQSVSMSVVLVSDTLDANYMPVPSTTDGVLDVTIDGHLKNLETLPSHCTPWVYDVTTNATLLPESTDVLLQVYNPSGHTNSESVFQNKLTLSITVEDCPLGFELRDTVCKCSQKIHINITCDITNSSFQRQGQYWIGEYSDTDDNATCLIVAECPLDYCESDSVAFTVNDTNNQCQYGRSGTLCGECGSELSLMLGSNRCGKCHNGYIALIIPFALFGIALVACLILLNLTVAVGTINGLIFYANVVKLYESSFFPYGSIPFLSQFISWLNLDFGIRTCFYNGMDSYGKVWLQYTFPFYIWCLIVFIIWLCRHSGRASRLMGNNAVPVLATLLLLSYTKLFRTIVGALHRIELKVSCSDKDDDIFLNLWYTDPNVLYTDRRHLALVLFSCFILVVFGLPYTMFHLFAAQIEKYCLCKTCCGSLMWLKPVIDAYGSSYKDEYRFWTGILLLARIVLLMVISFTDTRVGLAILATVIIIIFTCAYSLGGVYKKKWLNVLEAWFLLNAAVLAALSAISDDVAQVATIISVLLAILSFVAIVTFHAYFVLKKTTMGNEAIQKVKTKLSFYKRNSIQKESTNDDGYSKSKRAVTQSSIDVYRDSILFSSYESIPAQSPVTI